MKHIEAFEKVTTFEQAKSKGINGTLLCAYAKSHRAENELLDFSEVIWDYDVEEIVRNCKKYGIDTFTVSSNFSGLLKTLYEFEKLGCKIGGLTVVNADYKSIVTGEREQTPAVIVNVRG